MIDLKSNLFFKSKFTIEADNQDADILWAVVCEIKTWMKYKFNRNGNVVDMSSQVWTKFKYGNRLFDLQGNNTIYAESLYYKPRLVEHTTSGKYDENVYWACKIVEKQASQDGLAPRTWITEIGYQSRTKGIADISYVITYSDMPGFIGPCQTIPNSNIPRVIKNLLNRKEWKCRVGKDVIATEAIEMKVGDFPQFKEMLYDINRQLPIVYISPMRAEKDEMDVELLISPEEMLVNVISNALVVYSKDLQFSEEMRYFNNSKYNCYGGMIRLYLPINLEDPEDANRHRFFTSDQIKNMGEEAVLSIFRRALSQDVFYYDKMFRLEDCRRIKEQAEQDEKLENAEKLYIDESDERKNKEQIIQDMKNEIDNLKGEIYGLQKQNEVLLMNKKSVDDKEVALDSIRRIEKYPKSVYEIASFFEQVYSDRMVFSERGRKSLETCKTKCDVLWSVLYDMATTLYPLLKEQSPLAEKQFADKTGWECARCEGKMTHNDTKLMRQYLDEYNGQEINIETHIKNGNKESDTKFFRIYYAYEPTVVDKIIIGHCGKHLDNYSSRKIK